MEAVSSAGVRPVNATPSTPPTSRSISANAHSSSMVMISGTDPSVSSPPWSPGNKDTPKPINYQIVNWRFSRHLMAGCEIFTKAGRP